jgi:transcriptional regulator with XRE-family HTH domain
MAFNLKDFRENKLKMNQEEFAALIGERQDRISRLEQGDPDDIPTGILKRIAEKTGQTLDQLLEYEKPRPKALPVTDTWKEAELVKKTLGDYLAAQDQNAWTPYEKSGELLTEYRNIIKTNIRKPRVAFVGQSDVGKSTIINTLLGAEKMPTAWTPTTSITVYIKHIDDRPRWFTEEAWVFRADGDRPFHVSFLEDEETCKRLRLAGGGVDILKQYGTRQGEREHYREDAAAAVIYVDSDILKDVDLLDLPGFGTGDRAADDTQTQGTGEVTDVLVYLSRANGFMTGPDIECLRRTIPMLPYLENKDEGKIPPLGNLFIVASQAHVPNGGNPYQLKMILDNACTRFEQTLPDPLSSYFADRSMATGYNTAAHFRSRFFTYTLEIPELRKEFEERLRAVIELLPKRTVSTTKTLLKTYAKERGETVDEALRGYDRLIKNKEEEEAALSQILAHEPARKQENTRKRNSVVREIRAYNDASLAVFTENYDKTINIDNIVSIIKERGFKKKKEDIEGLSNCISAILENRLQDAIDGYAEKLKDRLDEYIAGFEHGCKVNGKLGVRGSIPFNAQRAFASGLAGVAAFGGLAVWASTLGNLGAYILVAKGVSLLSALGISIAGGTAAATAAVAAIGGPVVLGIALAVLAALALFAIFSGGWQKDIAKKLVKEYEKQNALQKYREVIEKFWLADTITAFNTSADAMEQAWQDEIANKKTLLDNYDIADIQRHIKAAEDFKRFLLNIPL